MPPVRSIRPRQVGNENDENTATTRLTRAKTASLIVSDNAKLDGATKNALATKKPLLNITKGRATGQRRAALGDVSNVVNKSTDSTDAKAPSKGFASKSGLTSKTQANNTKPASSAGSRGALGAKDTNKRSAVSDLKRPAAAAVGGVLKRRNTGSSTSQNSAKEVDIENVENQPPASNNESGDIKRRVIRDAKIESNKGVTRQPSVKVKPAVEAPVAEPIGIPDLDLENLDEPHMVAEYVVEIFEHLREIEPASMPNPDYMEHQTHLEWHLRGILVDWLVEVHTRFRMLPETIFLTINIVDRFLSARIVQLEKLQLVGITAMFIAAKYEEILSPHVQNYKHVADDGFSEAEILKAERFILETLNYNLSYPNPLNFLRRISKADNYGAHTRTLGKYLMEISLFDHRFMQYPPSQVAAAAMHLARVMLERGPWDDVLAHYAGYTEDEIDAPFKLMIAYLCKSVKHEAFFTKYASKKLMKVSIIARRWARANWQLYIEESDFKEDEPGTSSQDERGPEGSS